MKGVSPADSLLKMGTFVILGWRGSYYVSRLMELRAARQRPVVDSHLRQCKACSQSL